MTTLALPQLNGANIITNSRLRTYKTCPRKHFYAYELGVRPKTTATPLRLGSAFHLGVEAYANGADADAAKTAAIRPYTRTPEWANTPELLHSWLTEMYAVAALVKGYVDLWHPFDRAAQSHPLAIHKVVAAELPFTVSIKNPETGRSSSTFKFAGKIDAIVQLADGRLAVHEIKTTSDDIEPNSTYWRRLRIDEQISAYVVAARELGYWVETVLYDVTRKPAISPRQIPLVDEQGFKIVLNRDGQRVYTKDGKKPRESGSAGDGYIMQTRTEEPAEFGERLAADIAANPARYYARQEIPRLTSDIEDYRHELWQQAQQLRESQKSGRWFRNTNSCVGFGRCDYFDVCTNGIDLATETPDQFERVTNIHQELGEQA